MTPGPARLVPACMPRAPTLSDPASVSPQDPAPDWPQTPADSVVSGSAPPSPTQMAACPKFPTSGLNAVEFLNSMYSLFARTSGIAVHPSAPYGPPMFIPMAPNAIPLTSMLALPCFDLVLRYMTPWTALLPLVSPEPLVPDTTPPVSLSKSTPETKALRYPMPH
ncbi:hypothetical protein NDU88_008962 [Pleurodeles waltl]|uniref:Uncharacterized protein n=1 Tax=Pleurodeles waltl TaxID=8319 RepID=A0AAV7RZ58_PLEWA|nr:hypothetical protein NDU88_008962 [Pleurodeles waltl]